MDGTKFLDPGCESAGLWKGRVLSVHSLWREEEAGQDSSVGWGNVSGPDSWVPEGRWAGLQGNSVKAWVLGSLKVGPTSSRVTERSWEVWSGRV